MSEKHWTVVVQVKEVTPATPIRDGGGHPVKVPSGVGSAIVAMTERSVLDRLSLTVAAETEADAYRKAIALLEVNRPAERHLHRASCDDSGGNLVCGFPPGPTIASPDTLV